MVATGAIVGAGALYWWERSEPNYPAAQDEAVLLAAALERSMIVGSTNDLIYFYYTNTLDSVTNAWCVTNAAGYHPSWSRITACATSIVSSLVNTPTFSYRSTPGGTWRTGRDFWVAAVRPVAWDDARVDAFADASGSWGAFFSSSNQMDAAWWQTNIYSVAWQYPFEAQSTHYVSQSAFNDIAKPAAAMRYFCQRGVVASYTNYSRYGIGSAATFDTALSAAWAAVAGARVVTSQYWGPFEGVVSSVTHGGSYLVQLNLILTRLVITNLTPATVKSNIDATTRVVARTASPVYSDYSSAYATNGINVSVEAPRLLGSIIWSNALQWVRPPSDVAAMMNISVPNAEAKVTGWQIAKEPNGVGGYHWQEIMLISKHSFQHLTNSAIFWEDE